MTVLATTSTSKINSKYEGTYIGSTKASLTILVTCLPISAGNDLVGSKVLMQVGAKLCKARYLFSESI